MAKPNILREWRSKASAMASIAIPRKPTETPKGEHQCNIGFHDTYGSVRTLCKMGQLKDAVDNLHLMQQVGIRVDSSVYASLLQTCADTKSVAEGKRVQAHIIKTGFEPNNFVDTKLVIMYVKCCSVVNAHKVFDRMPEPKLVSWNVMITGHVQDCKAEYARQLFDKMPERNVVSWNAMIAGYAQNNEDVEALKLFSRMQWASVNPNQSTFCSVLSACASLAALEDGKVVHGLVTKMGFESHAFVENALLGLYTKCSSIDNARRVFDKMHERNVISWTAMLVAYTQIGRMEDACQLFERMPERNLISWTAMIAGFVQNECGEEALELFYSMQQAGKNPNQFTFDSVIRACANLEARERGKQLHTYIIKTGYESDISVSCALVEMYAKCRSMEDARQVFHKMPEQNVASCNALIGGYLQIGRIEDACQVFHEMPRWNVVSCNLMIGGNARIGRVEDARFIFDKMPERSVVSWNAMITGYTQNGKTEEARQLFDKMAERSVVSWNTMISGYAQNNHGEDALKLYFQMQREGVKWNRSTFSSVLSACTSFAILEQSKVVHTHIIKTSFGSDVFVGTALVDMYAKCGSIQDACQVFDKMPERNVVSWTAMITGYAQHGLADEALKLFEQMQELKMKPNHITLVGVLSACSHAGLAEEGMRYFDSMIRDYCISPVAEHYACMVDLLGRSGRLDEARDFINKMPVKSDFVLWGALLSACRVHLNIEIGKHAAEQLFELEPEDPATYVLLANLYTEAGRWDDAAKVRAMMKERAVKQQPGCSWIVVKNRVHVFLAGDRSHPHMEKIYTTLDILARQMEATGYVPNKLCVA